MEEGQRLNGQKRCIADTWIPQLTIGDARYMQSQWMTVPLPCRILHGMYESYNFKQSSICIIVERAFGRLKGVWRILHHPILNLVENLVPKLIYVCCILHNILLKYNDSIDEDTPFLAIMMKVGINKFLGRS